MSNHWLRLWHDMPNDPKWRTIARVSKQRIGDVLAVYMHLLTSASQHVTRGHADVTAEDLASALDVTEDVIQAILTAMQGRVLDGFKLSGWDKRQPKREDSGNVESGAKSSAERKREQREREKSALETSIDSGCHDMSRNVTLDTDTDTDKKGTNVPVAKSDAIPAQIVIDVFHEVLPELPKVKLLTDKRKRSIGSFCRFVLTSKKTDGERRAHSKDEALAWIRSYFGRVRDNDFLMGKTGRVGDHSSWQCDLDYLLTEKGMTQVIEKTRGAA